jgi:predicted MFS family arabinose efflux permease
MTYTIEGDEQEKFSKSIFAMVFFGIGEIFGCFYIGFVVDRYGSKTATVCNIINVILMTLFTLSFTIYWEYSNMALIMCFLWGF